MIYKENIFFSKNVHSYSSSLFKHCIAKQIQDFHDCLNATLFYLELELWYTWIRLTHAVEFIGAK